MKISTKYALLIALLSSTALASKSQIVYNNSYDQNSALKKVDTAHIKESKTVYHPKSVSAVKIDKAFVAQEIKIVFDSIEHQEAVSGICAEYVGKYVDHETIAELEARVIKQLISQDYLVPKVIITEKKDVLYVDVKVAPIDNVVILGQGKDSALMQEYADKITAQKPAKVKYTQRYIALMNKVPGYDVQYKLGEKDGQTELVIASEKTKAEAFAGVDNYGINDLGKMQTNGSVQVYSPFGGPDSVLMHASTTNHPDRLYDVGLGYSRILNANGTSGHLFVSHSTINSTKDNQVAAEDNKSYTIRTSLTHYLYLTAHQSLDGEFGINYRDSTNYTVDETTNRSRTDLESNYYTSDVGLKYTFKDKAQGRNILHLTYLQGISGDFKNYEDGGVLDNASNPDEHFGLVKFHFYRDQPLPRNFSVFTHLSGNYSGDNLPSSEMLSLGGRDFGRGYAFGTLDGTRMLAVAMELRYHHKLETNKFLEELQPYLFHDRGYVGKQYGDTDITHLSSLGGGLRFKFIQDIDLGFEAAVPGKKHYRVDGQDKEAKTKYGVYLNKVFKF